MAIWVEIHCDTPLDEAPMDDLGQGRCHSLTGDHPSAMVGDPAKAYPFARRNALAQGWARTRDKGWQCPGCQKYRVPVARRRTRTKKAQT